MTLTRSLLAICAVSAFAATASAQPCAGPPAPGLITYVPRVEARRVLIAWGTTAGTNTIGRTSPSHGPAEVWVDDRRVASVTDRNWAWVDGLAPDRGYAYTVCVGGRVVQGTGRVRTYPESPTRLRFIVMGDFGTGDDGQRRIASQLQTTVSEHEATDNPVRFVLTTGDNIYRTGPLPWVTRSGSGDKDSHWASKFFEPYANVIRSVPFLPSPGNHDNDETESRRDLETYLDNFFYEAADPYYTFSLGSLAQFFSLNTSSPSTTDADKAREFGPMSTQRRWLEGALATSTARWVIPFFHHPPFNAGPEHSDAGSRGRADALRSLFPGKVRVAFAGHEHNFQVSEASPATDGIRYVVTGAGGASDRGNFTVPLPDAHIERTFRGRHFLLVDLSERAMTITVIGEGGEVLPVDRAGVPSRLPPIAAR